MTSSSLPEDVSQQVKTVYDQSEHFRAFVARQQENRKEYEYNDKEGQYTSQAVDANEELASLMSNNSSAASPTFVPTLFKVAGKQSLLLIRSPHSKWFDLALADFLKKKSKLESGQSRVMSSSTLIMIAVLVLTAIFFFWPLWGFLVEIQANEHYRALGVEPGTPLNEVTKAYREAVRRLHPDRNPGCGQVCVTEMMRVKKAYEVLKGKDEASELEQQIDGMMAQIVMFMFGDVLVFTIHTGVVLSGIMRYYVFGSLDYEVNLDRPQPSHTLKTIVTYVDLAVRSTLVLCGLGVVVLTSDRNPLSLVAIVYAVVTQISGNRDSVEDLYRYRGLQVFDMLTCVLYFSIPAVFSHVVVPRVLASSFLSDGSSSFLPSFVEDYISDINENSFGWTLIVALIGCTHVTSALYTSPPAFKDNKVMMRCMLPIENSAVVSEKADTPNADGTADLIQTRKATKKSTLWFILTTILKRDLLAFGLRIPAPYRLAALAVYASTFIEMTQLPNEPSVFWDHRFRKAEDAAKRRIELMKASSSSPTSPTSDNQQQQQQQQQQTSSSSSSKSSGSLTTTTALGNFDFMTNDISTSDLDKNSISSPNYRPLQPQTFRMNDGERDVITQLDNEVPAWLELMRFDDYLLVRGQEIATESKFNNVLKEIAKRDMKVTIERTPQGHTKFTPIFASLAQQQQQQQGSSSNDTDKNQHYGMYRSALVSRLMSHSAEKFWNHESSLNDSLLPVCFFWIGVGVIVLILHLGGHHENHHLRIKASKIFLPEEAFAKVYDLNNQQAAGFSVNNCDEDPETEPNLLNNNKLQRSRNTKATVCRSLLVPDQTSRQATTLAANMLFNTEGYDPRVVVYAEDIMSEEEEFKLRSQVVVSSDNNADDGGDAQDDQSDHGMDSQTASNILRKKQQHQQQRVSEKQKNQRAAHALSLRKRTEDQKAAAKRRRENGEPEEGSGFFSDVPFFANDDPDKFGGNDPSKPSETDMAEFMKFAQELERRQRARGYRPKPEFRGKGTPINKNGNKKTAIGGKKKNNNLRLGAGNIKRDTADAEAGYGKFNVEDGDSDYEDSGDGAHLIYGAEEQQSNLDPIQRAQQEQQFTEAQIIKMKNVQMKLMQKMQSWIEREVSAGRLHLDARGKVIEQDRGQLVEWMLENDETWEPDPNFEKKKNKFDRLGTGPAADELRKLKYKPPPSQKKQPQHQQQKPKSSSSNNKKGGKNTNKRK